MFGWKEVLDTYDQQLFNRKCETVENEGIGIKIKHRYAANGSSLGRGRVEYGSSSIRNKVSYRLFVRKDDLDTARSLIYK